MDMFGEARMGRAVNMARNTILVQEITNSVLRNPDALISVARLKTADNYTYMHSVAVSALMVGLAKQLGSATKPKCTKPPWPACCTTLAKRKRTCTF